MDGIAEDSWRSDMSDEISDRAQQALTEGRYEPQDGQAQIEFDVETIWGKEPDHVLSVPALGAANHFFGLSLGHMWDWYLDFSTNAESHYKMICSTNSCARAASGALLAGGGEAFLKAPRGTHYYLPKEIATWARDLRAEIVAFNNRALRFEVTLVPKLRQNGPKHKGGMRDLSFQKPVTSPRSIRCSGRWTPQAFVRNGSRVSSCS